MSERMHPQDLRAMMAAHIYGQGLQLIGGVQWQNVNDYGQTAYDVDRLLASLERTAKPECRKVEGTCRWEKNIRKEPVDCLGEAWGMQREALIRTFKRCPYCGKPIEVSHD